jgi:hypothetical protein
MTVHVLKIKRFCFAFIFVLGCNMHSSAPQQKTDSPKGITNGEFDSGSGNFRQFLAKFRPVVLPLVIRPFEEQEIFEKLPLIYGGDSIFIHTEYKDTSLDKVYAYRLLPDTMNSYKVIWLEPAEVLIPVLTTFSKSGKKISQENLTIGGCGSDCCFSCNETIIINPDLSIYAADSIKSCKCDSSGPKENTMEKYVLMKTGHISGDGKIQLSQTKKKQD